MPIRERTPLLGHGAPVGVVVIADTRAAGTSICLTRVVERVLILDTRRTR